MLKNIKPLAGTLLMVFLLVRMKKSAKNPPHTYGGFFEVNKRLFEF